MSSIHHHPTLSSPLVLLLFLLTLFSTLLAVTECQYNNVVYELKIEFDTNSLRKISEAQQAVVLVSQGAGNGWYTIWSAFRPFPNNQITWNSTGYSVYVSESPLESGSMVFVGSSGSANPGLSYPLKSAGFFGPGSSANWVQENQIGIVNNASSTFLFGLTQDINVNSQWQTLVPISVEELLTFEHGVFPLTTSLYIFLGQASLLPGLLTTNLESIANTDLSVLTLDPNNPSILAQWDNSTGTFFFSY